MKSHQSLKKTIKTKAAQFAARLGLSPSTIYKWTEPSEDPTDSGSRNPVDVLEQTIEISQAFGNPPEDYFATLHYLDNRFGRVCVDVVPTDKPVPELSAELFKTMKEYGEMVQKAAEYFMDHRFTKNEKADLLKESTESLRQHAMFVQAVRLAKVE